jgi:hypothetical protein
LLTTASATAKEAYRNGMPGKTPFLAIGLSTAGAILLATRFYFIRELLVILAGMAVLFAVGAGALLLCVLLQEGLHWSVRQIIEAKQRIISLRGGSQGVHNRTVRTRKVLYLSTDGR